MKKYLFWVIWLVLVVLIVIYRPKNDTKSAGWYLDRQIELENQMKTLKKEREQVKAEKEKLYVEKINEGLITEQGQPQRTWTQAEQLANQPIK